MAKRLPAHLVFTLLGCLATMGTKAQMITGVWKGKINRQQVEVKVIQNGDSLTGTSYYYSSAQHFRRYSIKGYFDPETNEAVWWDDQLLEEKNGKRAASSPGRVPLLSRADFNCPGGARMMLDGQTAKKEDPETTNGEVHLDKTTDTRFPDEWDYVIDNYLVGVREPVNQSPMPADAPAPRPSTPKTTTRTMTPVTNVPAPVAAVSSPIEPVTVPKPAPVPALTVEEKFVKRQKRFVKEIPLVGDSIELRFYDNAEIDGDSISVFLNDKLLFTHIRLLGSAYKIKLAVSDLQDTNELIMVAENLGSIPPNTSLMVAEMGEEKYEARLESTEGSSAMVRFVKRKP